MQQKGIEMKARIISILIISFLASSCSLLRYRSLEEEYNKVWTGRSYAEIVEEFGAPDRIVPDGKDGNIAVVDTHFGYFDPDYTTTVSSDKIYKQFFIGSDDICYRVKSNEQELDPKSVRNSRLTWGISGGVLVFLVAILPAFL
jgi:hypothetical protein